MVNVPDAGDWFGEKAGAMCAAALWGLAITATIATTMPPPSSSAIAICTSDAILPRMQNMAAITSAATASSTSPM